MQDVFKIVGFFINDRSNTIFYHSKLRLFLWVFLIFPIIFIPMFLVAVILILANTVRLIFESIGDILVSEFEDFFEQVNRSNWFAPYTLIKKYFKNKKVLVPKKEFKMERNKDRLGRMSVPVMEEWEEKYGK